MAGCWRPISRLLAGGRTIALTIRRPTRRARPDIAIQLPPARLLAVSLGERTFDCLPDALLIPDGEGPSKNTRVRPCGSVRMAVTDTADTGSLVWMWTKRNLCLDHGAPGGAYQFDWSHEVVLMGASR